LSEVVGSHQHFGISMPVEKGGVHTISLGQIRPNLRVASIPSAARVRTYTSSSSNFGRSKKPGGPDAGSGPEWFDQHQKLTWQRLSKRLRHSLTQMHWSPLASALANAVPRTTGPGAEFPTAHADAPWRIPSARCR